MMTVVSIVTMLVVVGIVWGGLLVCLSLALLRESEKEDRENLVCMHLLLFRKSSAEAFPVLEPPSHLTDYAQEGRGRWEQLKAKAFSLYHQFRERFDYQEKVCAYLRHANRLEVHHPSTMQDSAAARNLGDFLQSRYSKHTRWLWIDGTLALLGSLLTPLPGPNVFFLYPAARAIGHYLARKGAQNALDLDHLSYKKEELIDQIQENLHHLHTVRPQIKELEEKYQINHLESHLANLKKHEG
ncbi:MAG: hypothetical protein ACRD1R_14220 [Acidobacteriota bacterium]